MHAPGIARGSTVRRAQSWESSTEERVRKRRPRSCTNTANLLTQRLKSEVHVALQRPHCQRGRERAAIGSAGPSAPRPVSCVAPYFTSTAPRQCACSSKCRTHGSAASAATAYRACLRSGNNRVPSRQRRCSEAARTPALTLPCAQMFSYISGSCQAPRPSLSASAPL